MIELIEKTLLTGIGALSLTQKKAEELVQEVREQLNLSEERGKELLSNLQKAAEENQKKLEKLAHEEVAKACDRFGLVSKEEVEKLRKKILTLEKQIKGMEK